MLLAWLNFSLVPGTKGKGLGPGTRLTYDMTQVSVHPRKLLGGPDSFPPGEKFDSVSSSLAPSCSLPDWVDMFPLHKFTCEGDVDGVRRCVHLGMSADERDSDSWAPLHYACW